MKAIILFFMILSLPCQVLAIDYNLCINYLKQSKPSTHLSMDPHGNLKADTKNLSSYTENTDRTQFNLTKTWSNTPAVKENIKIHASKNDDGSIMITHVLATNVEQLKHLARYPGNLSEYVPKNRHVPDTASTKTIIRLAIKNDKCYPQYVRAYIDYHPKAKAWGFYKEPIVNANSAICRKILDFFNNHPGLKTCADGNTFKQLYKLVDTYIKPMDGRLVTELQSKLSKANQLINLASQEMDNCDQYNLADTVKDDDLWKTSSKDIKTDQLPSAKVIGR